MNVDFELVQALQAYDPVWAAKVDRGELTKDQIRVLTNEQRGVVKELQVQIRAVKA
jgi:hypothetical protein